MIIKNKTIFFLASALLFSSCEKIPLANELLEKVLEQNQSLEQETPPPPSLTSLPQEPIQSDKLKEQNKQYKQATNELKEGLQDVNLSNARLLYTNRVLRNTSLNERQKEKVKRG